MIKSHKWNKIKIINHICRRTSRIETNRTHMTITVNASLFCGFFSDTQMNLVGQPGCEDDDEDESVIQIEVNNDPVSLPVLSWYPSLSRHR